MTDPLITAWNLLTPEEQDETGLQVVSGTLLDWDGSRAGVEVSLIVACEGVLKFRRGMLSGYVHMAHEWCWYRISADGRLDMVTHHPDRLTAAVLALQAERGTDAK